MTNSDTELLARVAAFRHAYDEAKSVSGAASGPLDKRMGEAVDVVFATSAFTLRGVLEKLKIVYLATGNGKANPEDAGDYDLALYQTSETSWFAIAIADLERLTGQRVISPEHDPGSATGPSEAAENDPVLVLLAEWHRLDREWEKLSGYEVHTPEEDRAEALSAQMGDIETQMLVARPTTPEGLSVLWRFLEIDIDEDAYKTCLRNLRRALRQFGTKPLPSAESLKEVRP